MGKVIVLLFALLLVASSTAVVLPSAHAEVKTIVVPEDYPTIQQAINSADKGDTVYVKDGTYNGTILISKAITLQGESSRTVINDWLINGKAAILITSSNVTVKGITIDNPSANTIWNEKRGIHLLGVSNCIISHNIIDDCDNGEGIWLYQSSSNLIEGNTVGGGYIGISLGLSTNNKIINNTVRSNHVGISLYNEAANNTLNGNDLYSNDIGISMSQSDGNEFFANKISSKQFAVQIGDFINEGIHVANNTFYHNNFVDNPKNIESYATTVGVNQFDNGKEGNYYSDYNGEDADNNGIGDSPYTMVTQGADITDNYPLIQGWAGDNLPPVITVLSPKNETYTVDEVSLNFTVSEIVSQIKYSLDSNQTITITGNMTLTELPNGNHTVILYATDLAGNEAAPKTVNFSVAIPTSGSISFVPIVAVAVLVALIVLVFGLLYRRTRLFKKP